MSTTHSRLAPTLKAHVRGCALPHFPSHIYVFHTQLFVALALLQQGGWLIALSLYSPNFARRQNQIGGSSQPRTCASFKRKMLRNCLFTRAIELFHNCFFCTQTFSLVLALCFATSNSCFPSIISFYLKHFFEEEYSCRVWLLK